MLRIRAGLVIVCAGVLTFGVVFTLLQVGRSEAAPGQLVIAPTPTVVLRALAKDSLAGKMVGGTVAIGVPITGSDVLLRDVQAGDRLDVLASLALPADGRLVTTAVVSGATVLRQLTSGEALMLDVADPDAVVLAHLVLGGTQLGYAVWAAAVPSAPDQPPLDEATARARLGLPAIPTPVSSTVEPTAGPRPRSVDAILSASGFLYQAQAGDTWASVAAIFQISANELQQWNEAPSGAPLVPGELLFIARKS
jgi:hypothetical protein